MEVGRIGGGFLGLGLLFWLRDLEFTSFEVDSGSRYHCGDLESMALELWRYGLVYMTIYSRVGGGGFNWERHTSTFSSLYLCLLAYTR